MSESELEEAIDKMITEVIDDMILSIKETPETDEFDVAQEGGDE